MIGPSEAILIVAWLALDGMESLKQKIGKLSWWEYRRFQQTALTSRLLENIVMPILHLDARFIGKEQ